MGRNTSFSLDEHYSAFIDEEIAGGRCRSASGGAYGIAVARGRETRLRALRQALIAGEQSGESTPFDFDQFIANKRAREPHHR